MVKKSRRKAKIKHRYSKAKENTSPGTLNYIGDIDLAGRINFIEYDSNTIEERSIEDIKKLSIDRNNKTKWIDIVGLGDESLIEDLGDKFKIHPLLLEDILDTGHRPKLEYDENMIFVIAKTMSYDKDKRELNTEQIAFILTKDILISFRERENPVFDNVIKRLKAGRNIRKNKADYLFYALLDALVDSYFDILEDMDEEIDLLEDELLDNPSQELLHSIYEVKREMIYIRNVIWPLRNIMGSLTKNDFELIDERTIYYLRDIHDHIIQIIDIIETYRDILSGMLDTYLSSIGNKTNDVMKVLTVFSTIFIPLTFLSGLYGTNFPNILAFKLKYSYQIFLAINLLVAVVTFIYLKKKDWV